MTDSMEKNGLVLTNQTLQGDENSIFHLINNLFKIAKIDKI
jgi:hypothetical protein